MDALTNVTAQHLVRDALGQVHQPLQIEIPHCRLTKQHTQCVDIASGRRGLPVAQFRGERQQCRAVRRGAGGRREISHQLADAKIGQIRLASITRELLDQHVFGFDVIVDHIGVVGRIECFGHFRNQPDTRVQIDRFQAPLRIRPLAEAAPIDVVHHEVVRRVFELGIVNGDDVAPAGDLVDPLEQLLLELKGPRLFVSGRELERSRHLRVFLAGQPRGTERPGAQQLLKHPFLARGNVRAGQGDHTPFSTGPILLFGQGLENGEKLGSPTSQTVTFRFTPCIQYSP